MGITGSTEKEPQKAIPSTPSTPRPQSASQTPKQEKLKPQTKPVSIKRDFDDDDEVCYFEFFQFVGFSLSFLVSS